LLDTGKRGRHRRGMGAGADFDDLAAPARRALAGAGLKTLADLGLVTEAKVAALHGMGPNALTRLKAKMAAAGLAFAKG
jgi:hypothetical protein